MVGLRGGDFEALGFPRASGRMSPFHVVRGQLEGEGESGGRQSLSSGPGLGARRTEIVVSGQL